MGTEPRICGRRTVAQYTLDKPPATKYRLYATAMCFCLFVCSSVANAYWWRRGLIMSAIRAALRTCWLWLN